MLHHDFNEVCMKKAFTLSEVFSPHPTRQSKFAFTLAEVLITLGIIGVVAAMTLPSLIADHREKQTVVQLKKVYSTLSNAYLSALNEYGPPGDWELPDRGVSGAGLKFMEKFGKFLQITKLCPKGDDSCYPKRITSISGTVSNSDTLETNIAAHFVLPNGSAVALKVWQNNCVLDNDICAFFEVDVNGFQKPNQYGKDLFRFYVTPKTIIPYGSPTWAGGQTFDNTCLSGGSGCTGWVLINENMDYLHCPDKLGWDRAHSCKE